MNLCENEVRAHGGHQSSDGWQPLADVQFREAFGRLFRAQFSSYYGDLTASEISLQNELRRHDACRIAIRDEENQQAGGMSNVPATSEQSVDPTEALHTCVQLFNTPRTQEIAESTCNTNAQARELQESVGRGQGRLAPLQQVLQHRERQLTSFRSPVDASVQHLLQREVDRVRSELQTRTRESVEAEADRDAALARTLPLESAMQLMQVQMCDLVDQLSGASALAGHVLREAVENEKRLLNADHDCCTFPLASSC